MYKIFTELKFRDKERLLPKILLRMKFTMMLMIAFILQSKASILAQQISLNVKNATLTEVVAKIRQQTKITILYNNETVAAVTPITLDVKNRELKNVLDECFKDQPVTYKVVNDVIIIALKPRSKPVAEEPPTAVTITGSVKDENGQPVPGVTVKVKNTPDATVTNGEGRYSIRISEGGTTLVFSFVGYYTQEISVGNKTVINVSLKPQSKDLEQVVVVAYGTQKQKDLTGAVSSVTAEDFNKGNQLSPQQLLQGKAAGLNISMNSGKPGGSATVTIRGETSVTGTNNPLYVIDGVPIDYNANAGAVNIASNNINIYDQEPVNPLQTLNPNDIESVTVLKDASATAIYGSRGANGVIVITTKSGKNGRTQITYNGTVGVATVAKKLDMLSADQYRTEVKSLGLPLNDMGANTNWQDKIYQTAVSDDHDLALSGGNDKTTYRTSVGYGKQNGVARSSSLEHANIYSTLTQKAFNNHLRFDINLNYGYDFAHLAPISNTVGGAPGTSMNYEAYVFNPTFPIRDANGNYTNSLPYRINPLSFTDEVKDQQSNQRLLGNFKTTYKIIDPLSVEATFGYTRQETGRNTYISMNDPLANGFNGYTSVQNLLDYSKLFETLIRFDQTWGKHTVDAIAGYSYQYFYGQSNRIIANGFLSDNFMWYSLQAAKTIDAVTSGAGSNQLLSTYARLNYNYDERFLLTATIRRDGSDRFGSNNQYGTFPSGSLAWRISKEKWFNVKDISDLKLRVSYGVAGNQDIGNLAAISTLSASSSGYMIGGQRVTIVVPTQYANPDLKWESTAQFDAGLNFGLFNNRLHGDFDVYRKRTTDLLLSVPVPSPSAIGTEIANVGSVENKGFEIELGATVIQRHDFSWNISGNFSRNINTVLSLSNSQYKSPNIQVAHVQGTISGGYAELIMPGQPLGTFYGPKYLGLDPNGHELYSSTSQILGNAQPKFTYAFSNTFNYKQWSLNFNFRGLYGDKIYDNTANQFSYKIDMPGQNALATVLADGVALNQTKNYSSRWIESGSFLRLDNATLGYNVKLNSKTLSNLHIFVNGQNLLLFTPYKGLDPEVNSNVTSSGAAPLGIDYLGYPRARTVSLGANVTFQ
jgi:iron complex outermembrane receptor protein